MINFGSLFTGAGGFDLGFEQAGMKVAWQCEKNKQCKQILQKHWPGVPLYEDITKKNTYVPVQLICGGDPCPIRSRARSNGKSKHPDLSGYFLAVVGRLRPRWVVRENVPAPDDVHQTTGESLAEVLPFVANVKGAYKTGLGTRQIIPCLTTNRERYDSRDCYVYDGRLRILDGEERTAFAGFPAGWFDGSSEASIARMTGNAVVVLVAEFLGRMIIEADRLLMGE
jgi:site-specific DNA-cytosine methylase